MQSNGVATSVRQLCRGDGNIRPFRNLFGPVRQGRGRRVEKRRGAVRIVKLR